MSTMSQHYSSDLPQAPLYHNIIPPPVPLTDPDVDFIPGEFLYVQNGRDYLQDAYRVISVNEWWGDFTQYLLKNGVSETNGFTFTYDTFYRNIMNEIGATSIGCGHSGYSMGFCMRVMSDIALNGEANYRKRYLTYNKNKGQ
jgi:hypothetical protein